MGQYWLHDLDQILQNGVGDGIEQLELVNGWRTRSRSSGGLDRIGGILDHHTVTPESHDWERDIHYIAFGNPYAPSPISQLYGGRDGRVAIIAAGAANHGGRGGAYKPGGPYYVGQDRANRDLIGKEMGNNGVGEQWPWKQIYASITVDALICLAEGWGPGHVFGHKEYCGPGTSTPGRKIDPYGPWENHPQGYWPDNSSWGAGQGDMDHYRVLVAKRMVELSQKGKNTLNYFMARPESIAPRIRDTRWGPVRGRLAGNNTYTVDVPQGAGKTAAVVNLTITQPGAPGYLSAWASGPRPKESKINWAAWQDVANEVTVPLAADGSFQIYVHSDTHLVVDLVGYFTAVE